MSDPSDKPGAIVPFGKEAAVLARLRERLMPITECGCEVWMGAMTAGGYGVIGVGSRVFYAHRVAYELLVGPIPAGLTVDHLCRVRLCCNPRHLEPVTRGENVLRGAGFAAVNAAKTHCQNGHPLDSDNLVPAGLQRGWRWCRICSDERERRRVRKRKRVVFRADVERELAAMRAEQS
jgi:hypothetical protein